MAIQQSETVSLTVNGTNHEVDIEPRELLATVLRDELGYTGTNVGCETGMCGACTVRLDGDIVKSCSTLAVQADGGEIETIEGMRENGSLHPIQEAFHEEHGLQCGFCTPGMVMTTIELLERNPDPSDEEIRQHLEGNICRCTGYQNIVKAIRTAADKMGADS
jgi:carbon-monoxide dehydrogenase small subunit